MTLHAALRIERAEFALAVDLSAQPGDVVAVLGPNGAGKSTLLQGLAGLLPLSAGRVELAGRVLEDGSVRLPPQARRIGMVFQDYRLFPHLSARDNVAFGPRSAGVPQAEAQARADRWMARLGLAGFERRRPSDLSGGQAQRVALARALCSEPDLLLLDEPMAALDVTARREVRALLQQELQDFAGVTLMVTHEPLEALALADRLVVLEEGGITQDAMPSVMVRRPATPYVARLLGLNLFRGTAHGGTLQVAEGGRLILTDTSLSGHALAVSRPSAVTLQREEPVGTSARNLLHGRLVAMEVLGDRVRVSLDSRPPVTADVTAAAVADLRLRIGDLLWASLKATDLEAYPDGAR